jgi:hypothetical protein
MEVIMSDIRIRFSGDQNAVSELERFCEANGIRTYRSTEIGNSIIPPDAKDFAKLLTVLIVVAKYDVIPKAIIAFRKTRKPPVTFNYIRNGELLVLEAESSEDVVKIINEIDYFKLSEPDEPPEPPPEYGEMGFHTGIKPPENE